MFQAIMTVGGMEGESWQVIFPSCQRHFCPSGIQFKMLMTSVFLAGTTVQGLSGYGEAKSSMHSGEVPGDELTHLDEEVANSNRMN